MCGCVLVIKYLRSGLGGLATNVRDCIIVVSSNFSPAVMFTSGLTSLGNI